MTSSAHPLPPGPLMIDIEGLSLTDLDRERLVDPRVGGLILFARNYRDPEQLATLCAGIHALRPLLIAIDHEGGRVQRCREGFTRLPAMNSLGIWWDHNPDEAREAAHVVGYVLAAELRARGVDFSFTPVLDLDWGRSTVVGTRAFHHDPATVAALAEALVAGLRVAGMGACGKHFPGHGWAEADSHIAIPVDERDPDAILIDMAPYRCLELDAVMPAHVIYPRMDSRPAGFSPVWIDKLRKELGFDGVIFSDDLSMEGAAVAGDIVARANAAWTAGCDMLLVCNAPDAVGELLERWTPDTDPGRAGRVRRLLPRQIATPWSLLAENSLYRQGQEAIARCLSEFSSR
ncbi:MAG: beta-N-acetylhexosaminidase [Proteobacteria bacterium]|nr:beta-N-acetylhexosaminidase [Pseudomonadota bacterium]HQR04738.1 beta-N-acetylhexosaminidase [Rhodocyclaceae bacterium]